MNLKQIIKSFYNEVMKTHIGDGDPDETFIEVVAEEFVARDPITYFNMGVTPRFLIKSVKDKCQKQ